MKVLKGLCRAFLFLFPVYFFCGGGSDVGNPDISGFVSFNSGESAGNATVIIGREGAVGSIDISFQTRGDIYLCFTIQSFDTVYSDRFGAFRFDSVPPGNYVLVASRDSMLGLVNVVHNYYEESQTELLLEAPAKMKIETYSGATADSADRFVVAHLAGTVFTTAPDTTGVFTFERIPSGDLEFILYKSNGDFEKIGNYTTLPGCSSSLVVDPLRSSDYWTVKECGPREPLGRPYVLWSAPLDGATDQMVKSGTDYDVAVQFSHPMDTRNTALALSAVSSDSLTSIDTLWWQGSDMIYIALCTTDSTGNCSRDLPVFRTGVEYSVLIDTTAQSAFGVKFAYPEILTFKP